MFIIYETNAARNSNVAIDDFHRSSMYQMKNGDKMADSENLTLCISINSSKMCIYFCKTSVTVSYSVLSAPGKKLDSQPLSVCKLILLLTPVVMGMKLCGIPTYFTGSQTNPIVHGGFHPSIFRTP